MSPLRYVTADLPGIGGTIKQRPEDFLVEEIPLYTPAGQGEHVYLLIEKRLLSTFEMVDVVARHFGVHRSAVGYAGLKDKHAVTRQVVSVHVPGRSAADFPDLRHDKVAVLWADQHVNKLRRGHLSGNRFSIRIRGVGVAAALTAAKVLGRLSRTGVPNRFGEQRFGHLQTNHLIGRALVQEDFKAALDLMLGPDDSHPASQAESRRAYAEGRFADALHLMPRSLGTEREALRHLARGAEARRAMLGVRRESRGFFLSAMQSAVFNAVLDGRVRDGTFDRLVEGDLAFLHGNRAVFLADRAVLEDPGTADRLRRFEISPSGPIWAEGMPRASGPVHEAEVAALAGLGLSPEDLAAHARRESRGLEGDRRPLRVALIDPDAEGGADENGPFVRVSFELPRGSFATVVLREIMKPAIEADDSP